MGFVAEKVAMGHIFLSVLWFSPMSTIPLAFHVIIFHSHTPDTVKFLQFKVLLHKCFSIFYHGYFYNYRPLFAT
jgi:hypothetical protein